MSNSLAIAAVTATLQGMLNKGLTADLPATVPASLNLNNAPVTTRPPDKARPTNDNRNQLNVFLYQTTPNAALRNTDLPARVRPGETGQPPLALNLHYLISAYGQDDDDTAAHILLGQAMRILQERPLLSADDILAALPGNDLHEQFERVRVSIQPISLDEMSKLWTTFQTQYRVSTAYQVAVVLIENRQPTRAPLPVLMRGEADAGVVVEPSLLPPFPTLTDVRPPGNQPSARLGETLTLAGHHLDGTNREVRFRNARLDDPIDVPVASATATEWTVNLPNALADWPAGYYTLAPVVQRRGESTRRVSNELAFALAPAMQLPPTSVTRDAVSGIVTVVLSCSPEVRPAQRVAMLVGEREVPAEPHPAQTGTLTFVADELDPGDYFVRLRVDGVDSRLIDRSVSPPAFFANQKVTIP